MPGVWESSHTSSYRCSILSQTWQPGILSWAPQTLRRQFLYLEMPLQGWGCPRPEVQHVQSHNQTWQASVLSWALSMHYGWRPSLT